MLSELSLEHRVIRLPQNINNSLRKSGFNILYYFTIPFDHQKFFRGTGCYIHPLRDSSMLKRAPHQKTERRLTLLGERGLVERPRSWKRASEQECRERQLFGAAACPLAPVVAAGGNLSNEVGPTGKVNVIRRGRYS